jgi:hypothetical protein
MAPASPYTEVIWRHLAVLGVALRSGGKACECYDRFRPWPHAPAKGNSLGLVPRRKIVREQAEANEILEEVEVPAHGN